MWAGKEASRMPELSGGQAQKGRWPPQGKEDSPYKFVSNPGAKAKKNIFKR